jgi:hypothetical protein
MFVSKVVIGRDGIRICGPKDQLLKAVSTDEKALGAIVPTFARDWRTRRLPSEGQKGINRQLTMLFKTLKCIVFLCFCQSNLISLGMQFCPKIVPLLERAISRWNHLAMVFIV